MEKISVALATYNGEKYIEKQLDSIRNQTIKPYEVVIVDDKSSDRTVALINEFIAVNNLVNWKLFVNEKNVGYRKNFYNALKKVTGEVIFLSDQDDEWHKNKIEVMLKLLRENTDIYALNSAVNLIDESSNKIILKLEKNYYNSNFLYMEHIPQKIEYFDIAYIGLHNVSPGCTMAVRREIVDIFLHSYNYLLPHDWFMNLIASADRKCAFLNVALTDYRQHGNNAIGANTSPAAGILKKTRMVRINDYLARNDAIQRVIDITGINSDEILKEVVKLNTEMIDFYKKPNPLKLIRLRKKTLYFQLAKKKVQMWEVLVSFGMDKVIIKILKERN